MSLRSGACTCTITGTPPKVEPWSDCSSLRRRKLWSSFWTPCGRTRCPTCLPFTTPKGMGSEYRVSLSGNPKQHDAKSALSLFSGFREVTARTRCLRRNSISKFESKRKFDKCFVWFRMPLQIIAVKRKDLRFWLSSQCQVSYEKCIRQKDGSLWKTGRQSRHFRKQNNCYGVFSNHLNVKY